MLSQAARRLGAPSSLARLGAGARRFSAMPEFAYEELFQYDTPLTHPYRKLTSDYVLTLDVGGKKVLSVEPEALRLLSSQAMIDIAHLLRPGHLQQLSNILKDPEASFEEKYEAQRKIARMPRDASATRVRNRCELTGRPRSFYRKFGLSRIALREEALKGNIPGVVKSSW